jgi:SAM-dependent methyltransferase
MHGNTQLLFDRYARPYFRPGIRVLEVGPDLPSTLRRLTADESIQWHTVDICRAPQLTYAAVDEYSFPIPDNAYDIVVAANVMEHVRKIWLWIREVSRVCKPGGHVITINPVSWPFHEYPIDCWRAYPDGMTALYEEGGLDVIVSKCESLEDSQNRRHLPGRSLGYIKDHEGWKAKIYWRLFAKLGLPIERPYDTVTIGKKLRPRVA